MKVAAGLSAFLGVGFGIPCALGIRHLAATGEVWIFLGFPTYGDGPFARAGIVTTVPLLTAFLLVCVTEVGLAWVLWGGSMAGAWAALALLPVEMLFWIGFALPVGPVLGIARTLAVAVALATTWRGRG